jgi:hypothetical protein
MGLIRRIQPKPAGPEAQPSPPSCLFTTELQHACGNAAAKCRAHGIPLGPIPLRTRMFFADIGQGEIASPLTLRVKTAPQMRTYFAAIGMAVLPRKNQPWASRPAPCERRQELSARRHGSRPDRTGRVRRKGCGAFLQLRPQSWTWVQNVSGGLARGGEHGNPCRALVPATFCGELWKARGGL